MRSASMRKVSLATSRRSWSGAASWIRLTGRGEDGLPGRGAMAILPRRRHTAFAASVASVASTASDRAATTWPSAAPTQPAIGYVSRNAACDSENWAVNTMLRLPSVECRRSRRADGVLIIEAPAPMTVHSVHNAIQPAAPAGVTTRKIVVALSPPVQTAPPVSITARSEISRSRRATPVLRASNRRRNTPGSTPDRGRRRRAGCGRRSRC